MQLLAKHTFMKFLLTTLGYYDGTLTATCQVAPPVTVMSEYPHIWNLDVYIADKNM